MALPKRLPAWPLAAVSIPVAYVVLVRWGAWPAIATLVATRQLARHSQHDLLSAAGHFVTEVAFTVSVAVAVTLGVTAGPVIGVCSGAALLAAVTVTVVDWPGRRRNGAASRPHASAHRPPPISLGGGP